MGRGKRLPTSRKPTNPATVHQTSCQFWAFCCQFHFQMLAAPTWSSTAMCLSLKCRRLSQGSLCRCVRFSARKGYNSFNRREKVTVGEDLIKDHTFALTCDVWTLTLSFITFITHLNAETTQLWFCVIQTWMMLTNLPWPAEPKTLIKKTKQFPCFHSAVYSRTNETFGLLYSYAPGNHFISTILWLMVGPTTPLLIRKALDISLFRGKKQKVLYLTVG